MENMQEMQNSVMPWTKLYHKNQEETPTASCDTLSLLRENIAQNYYQEIRKWQGGSFACRSAIRQIYKSDIILLTLNFRNGHRQPLSEAMSDFIKRYD
jgi:hypothetical protein